MDLASSQVEESAGAKLWQMRAESAFDRLWNVPPPRHMTEGLPHVAKLRKRRKIKQRAKRRALRWLAEQLAIQAPECRFEAFTSETCAKVIDLCQAMTLEKVRAWSKERGH